MLLQAFFVEVEASPFRYPGQVDEAEDDALLASLTPSSLHVGIFELRAII